jgi:4a-hydroxytetrahydrobiopterin dehydratase
MDYTPVTPEQVAADPRLCDWRFLLQRLEADFQAPSYAAAAAIVVAIADAADRLDHHPDTTLHSSGRVRVVTSTHFTGGVSAADVVLAVEVSRIAAAHGAVADPARLAAYEVAIDTMDADRIRPFWAAVLGYRDVRGNLVDPLGVGPAFWFQEMDEPRTQRDRFHVDVTVPHDRAEERVAAALAAGGRLVTAEFARSWWVLADADGNEACVCTWQDRD